MDMSGYINPNQVPLQQQPQPVYSFPNVQFGFQQHGSMVPVVSSSSDMSKHQQYGFQQHFSMAPVDCSASGVAKNIQLGLVQQHPTMTAVDSPCGMAKVLCKLR